MSRRRIAESVEKDLPRVFALDQGRVCFTRRRGLSTKEKPAEGCPAGFFVLGAVGRRISDAENDRMMRAKR